MEPRVQRMGSNSASRSVRVTAFPRRLLGGWEDPGPLWSRKLRAGPRPAASLSIPQPPFFKLWTSGVLSVHFHLGIGTERALCAVVSSSCSESQKTNWAFLPFTTMAGWPAGPPGTSSPSVLLVCQGLTKNPWHVLNKPLSPARGGQRGPQDTKTTP